MNLIQQGKNLFCQIDNFSIQKTLKCGQTFRWREVEKNKFIYITGNCPLLMEDVEDGVLFYHMEKNTFLRQWVDFFDLTRDMDAVHRGFPTSELIQKATDFSRGLRILKQSPFEVTLSFIISSNNHIPRIQGCIEELCENFGEKIETPWGEEHAFPSLSALQEVDAEGFRNICRVGYRDRYLTGTIQLLSNHPNFLEEVYAMDYKEGKKHLMILPGVGEKVADCILLFGYHKMEAFPMDIWMKRAMASIQKEGQVEKQDKGKFPGYLQQYLFYHEKEKKMNKRCQRNLKIIEENERIRYEFSL